MVGSVSLLIERQAMRLPEGTMTLPFSSTTSSSTTALTGPGFFGSIGEAMRAMIRESLGSDSATTRGRSGIGVVFSISKLDLRDVRVGCPAHCLAGRRLAG